MSLQHRQFATGRDGLNQAMHLRDGDGGGRCALRAARRYLCATMLASALSGGALAVCGELWIKGAHEAVVLSVLFAAVCFYVLAEAGFGEMALRRARQDDVR